MRATRLVQKISPDVTKSMGRVHDNAKPGSFFSHENVQAFLRASTLLGVLPHSLFESNALVAAQKDVRAVVLCILSLARVSFSTVHSLRALNLAVIRCFAVRCELWC